MLMQSSQQDRGQNDLAGEWRNSQMYTALQKAPGGKLILLHSPFFFIKMESQYMNLLFFLSVCPSVCLSFILTLRRKRVFLLSINIREINMLYAVLLNTQREDVNVSIVTSLCTVWLACIWRSGTVKGGRHLWCCIAGSEEGDVRDMHYQGQEDNHQQ